MTTARDYALYELDRRRLPNWPPHQLRTGKTRPTPPTDPRDYALAEQLTTGVVQNLLLLQRLIEHYSSRPLKKVDPLVQKILAIGLYQLRSLTRIPPTAAVDQAVAQAKRFGRTAAAGFVNAILRNALRSPTVPLPDPTTDPEAHATLALSHPPELYRRLRDLTDPATALDLCRHDNQEPPTIVRLFPNTDPSQLATEGITLTPHAESPHLYVVQGAKQSTLADFAARGLAQVQDPTAAKVATLCDLHPGQLVLDRCAGLGTKTLQLQQAVGDSGKVFAMDPSLPRAKGLVKLLSKRGISNVFVEPFGWFSEVGNRFPDKFSRVLVDAPCSNSGVLPRRPEARYAQDDKSLTSLRDLQLKILADTAPRVSPDGLLIYSTCSIWPEENTGVVSTFLSTHPHFKLIAEHATLPSTTPNPTSYHDGGYVAILRRAT